ncbi:hypothetical protein Bca4012_091756 [Brassica carinata]
MIKRQQMDPRNSYGRENENKICLLSRSRSHLVRQADSPKSTSVCPDLIYIGENITSDSCFSR